jgi:integrase
MADIQERISKSGVKTYTARVRLKGYSTQTATFKRLTDAKKWVQNTESAIREGRHFKTVEAKKHTLGDMLDKYIKDKLPEYNQKEQAERKSKLDWWKNRIGVYLLSDVTPPLIVECREELKNGVTFLGTKRSPATVVRYMAALSHAFRIAIKEWHWLDDSPMRKVDRPQEPKGRVRFLDDNERQRLLLACQESKNKLLYMCVVLSLSTGMRKSELMCLKWQDLNLNDGYLILHKTKNGNRRRVPLSGLGLELLREHAKARRLDTQLLFPGIVHADKPLDLRAAFEAALKRAEIQDFHWHDLRHCTASYLAMNNASLAEIAEILGHETLDMVKRYAHLSDGHVSDVVASMNNKIFGGAQ